jgi:parallel beta-helix repeat protein
VSGCTADQNGYGIYIRSGTVSGCSANTNNYGGIYVAGDGGVVIGNTCIGNVHPPFLDGVGIYINGNNTRVEDNHVTASGGAGIQVESGYTNNIIIKNSVSVNGANNYVLPGAQIVGPIITNTVSGIITNSNPWANFSF